MVSPVSHFCNGKLQDSKVPRCRLQSSTCAHICRPGHVIAGAAGLTHLNISLA